MLALVGCQKNGQFSSSWRKKSIYGLYLPLTPLFPSSLSSLSVSLNFPKPPHLPLIPTCTAALTLLSKARQWKQLLMLWCCGRPTGRSRRGLVRVSRRMGLIMLLWVEVGQCSLVVAGGLTPGSGLPESSVGPWGASRRRGTGQRCRAPNTLQRE